MSVSSDFKAHGLQGSLAQPDWPPLLLNEVDRLLRRYPQARGAVQLLSRSPRPFSAASLVETPQGRVFVKRHHQTIRNRDGLMEEHRFMNHLNVAEDTLVQPALVTEDGRSVVCDADWTYEVHPVAHGIDVYEQALSWTPFLSAGHALSAGRAMARLHKAAKTYNAPPRKTGQLISSFSIFRPSGPHTTDLSATPKDKSAFNSSMAMADYLNQRPKLKIYAERRDWKRSLDELFLPFYAELHPWLSFMAPLWTHNDFHASNLTWSAAADEARVQSVIDFGLADRTNAMHDLATAIERNVIEWLRIADHKSASIDRTLVHLDHLDAMLQGYDEITPLSYEEARGLAAMLPLVHCEFALSETDYFLSILDSEEKAYLAYEGYFLGHTLWFQSVEGKRLLEHLERWADSRPRDRQVYA